MKKTTKKNGLSERNKKFWALPAAKKRIAIAKDIIKQIEAKLYAPESGTYFRVRVGSPIEIGNTTGLDTVLKKIKKQDAVCEVCEIGACFASMVNLGNKITAKDAFQTSEFVEYGESIDAGTMKSKLRKVFSESQLSLIECAFERRTTYGGASYDERFMAKNFGAKYISDDDRMIAISENIIKNKGTFKP